MKATFRQLEKCCGLLQTAEEGEVIVEDYKAENFLISTDLASFEDQKWLDPGAFQTKANRRYLDSPRESNLRVVKSLSLKTLHNLLGLEAPEGHPYRLFLQYQQAKQKGKFDQNPSLEALYLKLAGLITEEYQTTAEVFEDVSRVCTFVHNRDLLFKSQGREASLLDIAIIYEREMAEEGRRKTYKLKLESVLQEPEKPSVSLGNVDSDFRTLLISPFRFNADYSSTEDFRFSNMVLDTAVTAQGYVLDEKPNADKIAYLEHYLMPLAFTTDCLNRCREVENLWELPTTAALNIPIAIKENIRGLYRFLDCEFTKENAPNTDSLIDRPVLRRFDSLADFLHYHNRELYDLVDKMAFVIGKERYEKLRSEFLDRVEKKLADNFVEPDKIARARKRVAFALGDIFAYVREEADDGK